MKSGCSESNASGSWVSGCAARASCHHTSRPSVQATSCPVRRTTSTWRTEPARSSASSTAGLSADGRAPAVATVGGDDDRCLGVVDAGAEGLGREPAEDDRVRCPDPRAGEHRDGGLGDHRQVDRDAVAGPDPECGQRVRGLRDLALQVGVGDVAGVAGLALEMDRDLVAVAGGHVPVDAVDRDVEAAADEPLREGCIGPVEDGVPGGGPLQVPGLLRPEGQAVGARSRAQGRRWRSPARRSPRSAGSGGPRAAGSREPRGSRSLLGVRGQGRSGCRSVDRTEGLPRGKPSHGRNSLCPRPRIRWPPSRGCPRSSRRSTRLEGPWTRCSGTCGRLRCGAG